MKRLLVIAAAGLALAMGAAPAVGDSRGSSALFATAVGHPRLFIRQADLPRLRSWASRRNPLWAKGMAVLARTAKADMNSGHVPDEDGGSDTYEEYTTEAYAELFAFLSLVDPNPVARADYGRRARTLLMHVIDRALPGAGDDDEPFRDPYFSTSDRSRWNGEAFALTVDWAYRYFSAADKGRIRTVFLRWAREQFSGYPLGGLDGVVPTPKGRSGDRALLRNHESVRWSLNNYYAAHARNLGLMALALDPQDDPGGQLHAYLRSVTGQWLFVINHALLTDAAGGLSPEGFEYGPEALGSIAQLLLAMRTAGEPRPPIEGNRFWRDFLPAVLHSLPPRPTRGMGDSAWRGQLWQPAFFGSTQNYWAIDLMKSVGPLAVAAGLRGDRETVDAVRWIETNVPPGGKGRLLERVGNTDQLFDAIFYFLLFDPDAAPPADPRPRLPLAHFAPGLNRLLARTCWCPGGRMFTYGLAWNEIDHQRGDGNDFGFYRNGEWLTKQRTGYGSGGSYTDYHNSLSIENSKPEHTDGDRGEIWRRGDQWVLDPAGDPRLVTRSAGPGFVSVTGDATNLYNSTYEQVSDVLHASRSIVWVKPDTIVVYDRAATRSQKRFKRFWLQLPVQATITRNRAELTTRRQRLLVTSLLPRHGKITAERDEDVGDPATDEPMQYRLRVEDPRRPKIARFLHVLQAGDLSARPARAELLRAPGITGAAVGDTAVLFPAVLGRPLEHLRIDVPGRVRRILVTGLRPGGAYSVNRTTVGNRSRLTIRSSGTATADKGGALAVGE